MRPAPKELLRQADVPAFLITDLTNIRYLTGLTISTGFLLVTSRRYILFVDSRYKDVAERANGSFHIRDIGELAGMLKDIGECGFEDQQVTVSRFRKWKQNFKNTKFVQTNGAVEAFRRQKDETEIRHLKRARRMTREILRRIPSVLRRGITEEKLARQILIWALEMGADGLSFDPIVGFGTHTSSPHHRPTTRSLQKGQVVQIDIGVKYKGYCADMSEVFFTAKPTKLQARLYGALIEARDLAMAAATAGASTKTLDLMAREILEHEGVEDMFTHALGHGVGLDIHEGVSISSKGPDARLLPGEVVTIEPGIYFPGKFGMRVEDMVFVE